LRVLNEELVKKEGMAVPQTLLFTAIKTKEEWQNLFNKASEIHSLTRKQK
jgi:hypothetical protein